LRRVSSHDNSQSFVTVIIFSKALLKEVIAIFFSKIFKNVYRTNSRFALFRKGQARQTYIPFGIFACLLVGLLPKPARAVALRLAR